MTEMQLEILTPLQQEIVSTLLENGASTRKQLVSILDTPRTTIYDNLVKLKQNNLVSKNSKNNHKQGRPKVYWKAIKES